MKTPAALGLRARPVTDLPTPAAKGHTASVEEMQMPPPNAVVLLSGGLDSATTLALARRDGFAAHALTFRYGQRHEAEVAAARRVAESLGAAQHRIIAIDLRAFG